MTTKTSPLQSFRPTLVSFLRALVLAAAALITAWPLTVGTGVLMALLGAFLGALSADRAAATPLRLPSTLMISGAAFVVGVFAARFLVTTSLFASVVGPVNALWLSEAALWLAMTLPFFFALRFLAARKRLFIVFEVLVIAGAVAWSLAAHREGMIHRPYSIGDWAFTKGLDPVLLLLLLGICGLFLMAALLMSENRRRRLVLHFGALAALALLLLVVVRVGDVLPQPRGGDELGLTGDPNEGEDESDEENEGGQSEGDPSDQMDDLDFRDNYNSSGEQAPVAVVLLHDEYSPPPGVYYFRQTAFSQYNGRRLVQATRDGVDTDIMSRFPSKPEKLAAAPVLSDKREALRTTMGLMIDHVRPFALDSPAAVRPARNPNPVRFRRVFDVLSHVQTLPYDEMIGLRPGDPDWTREEWAFYTDAPSDPRYKALAERLMQMLREDYKRDPLAQALAIKAYLDQEGIYSRRSKHAGAEDPAGSFLFGNLTGYCVHFAHAATYLMRAQGLPARVAAGYAIEESARGGGSTLMVRGGDAHAWPELYLEGVGWVVVDLAPEQTLDEPAGPPDQTLQRMLGEMMREDFQEMDMSDEAAFSWSFLKLIGLILLFGALAVGYGVKFYRALAPFFGGPKQLYRSAYRASLDRLAEVGVRRRFGESRESFSQRATQMAPSFSQLTEHHLQQALGSQEKSPPRSLQELMIRVQDEIGGRVPLWRRLAGFLNPYSWLMAR